MPALTNTSWLKRLELSARIDHRDEDGGGQIIRTFYVEPYTAYPAVLTALKGTVTPGKNKDSRDRVKPHADPNVLKNVAADGSTEQWRPYFYCTDVKAVPWNQDAVSGSGSKGFVPHDEYDAQLTSIRAALDVPDDFDFACNPDTLTLSEILANGQPDYSRDAANHSFTSRGKSGALIVATYRPTIWIDGWSQFHDPFDFLDPVWTPITKLNQLGRTIKLFKTNHNYEGLSDTATLPEGLLELTFWRRLVPYLPTNAIGRLTGRVNNSTLILGNQKFPPETVRIEPPQNVQRKIAPDGQLYYDFQVKLTFRTHRDYVFDLTTNDFTQHMVPVTWNHGYGAPSLPILNLPFGPAGFYPVGFFTTTLQGFGNNSRSLYLTDTEFDNPAGPAGNQANPWGGIDDLWNRGWDVDDGDWTKNV